MGVGEKAYEVLRERLVGGYYTPGEQLKEEHLARELGLSRTPVRSALRRLVQNGLATADAGQGVHVAEWGGSDIEETFQIRLLLEPYAAGLAAARGGDALTQSLEHSNAQMDAAIRSNDVDGIQQANRAFHAALLEHCGSPRLRMILELMIDIPIIVRSFYLSDRAELEQSLTHHEELTRAAAMNDSELAQDVMRLHLRVSHKRFVRNRDQYRHAGQPDKAATVTAAGSTGKTI
jgi:DNA-binding GntR family transcriptional regulator